MKRRRGDNLLMSLWWVAAIASFAVWVLWLCGCGAKAEAKDSAGRFDVVAKQTESVGVVSVLRDRETGREYLMVDGYQSVALTLMPESIAEEPVVQAVEIPVKREPVFSLAEPPVAEEPEFELAEPPVAEMPVEVEESPLESLGVFKVSAYCSCQRCCCKTEDDPWYGITATGTKATEGRTIAVDPKVIPYGSVVYFEGVDGLVGGYVAEDCGGAIKGKDIDLYFDSHEEALSWGVKELEVFRYEE